VAKPGRNLFLPYHVLNHAWQKLANPVQTLSLAFRSSFRRFSVRETTDSSLLAEREKACLAMEIMPIETEVQKFEPGVLDLSAPSRRDGGQPLSEAKCRQEGKNTWFTSICRTQITSSRWPMLCDHQLYVRLLLEDSMLKAHQHGLHVTRECECGQGIEDTYHFLHECTSCRYTSGTLWWSEDERLERQFQWRPTYTVGSAPSCNSGFQLTSVIKLYWQPSSTLKILHVVCNMTTELCQPSTSVAQFVTHSHCDLSSGRLISVGISCKQTWEETTTTTKKKPSVDLSPWAWRLSILDLGSGTGQSRTVEYRLHFNTPLTCWAS